MDKRPKGAMMGKVSEIKTGIAKENIRRFEEEQRATDAVGVDGGKATSNVDS